MANCEKDGHIFGSAGVCVFCLTPRPPARSGICSECAEPWNEFVPHTCYVHYDKFKKTLQNIVECYDARSELYTNDADCAGNLADQARAVLAQLGFVPNYGSQSDAAGKSCA